jgi:hypothetical protein
MMQYLSSYRVGTKIQIQNSGCISNHEGIIYTFKIQMPSLNQVIIKVVFGKIIIIMITLLSNKVKNMRQIFK